MSQTNVPTIVTPLSPEQRLQASIKLASGLIASGKYKDKDLCLDSSPGMGDLLDEVNGILDALCSEVDRRAIDDAIDEDERREAAAEEQAVS